MGTPKLRLVHVLVQPVFMLDDGDTLKTVDHPVVTIPANEWPTYSGERFLREIEDWQKQIDAQHLAADPHRATPQAESAPGGSGSIDG